MNCFDWGEEQFHCGEGCDACIDSPVRFIPENCVACKSCEIACALRHSMAGDINTAIGEYPRPLSRLSIVQSDDDLHLITCVHCKLPKCVEACKASAITKDGDGVVTIDHETCVGCLACVKACPFGIQIRDHEAIKCDLCSGAEPSCVLACKCGALIYG